MEEVEANITLLMTIIPLIIVGFLAFLVFFKKLAIGMIIGGCVSLCVFYYFAYFYI